MIVVSHVPQSVVCEPCVEHLESQRTAYVSTDARLRVRGHRTPRDLHGDGRHAEERERQRRVDA